MTYKPLESVSIPEGYLLFMRIRVSFKGRHNRTKGLILYLLQQANGEAIKVKTERYSYQKREPRSLLNPSQRYQDRATHTVTKTRQEITIKEAGTISALNLYKRLNGIVSYGSVRATLTRLTRFGYVKNHGGVYGLKAKGARFLYACDKLGVLKEWIRLLNNR